MTYNFDSLMLRYGTLESHGYRVERFTAPAVRPVLWCLRDMESGGYLGIGSGGQVSPRKADAILEGYRRVAQDEESALVLGREG